MNFQDLTENERLALDAIRRQGGLTRAGIAQTLGITRAHATNVTRELAAKELIEEEPQLQGAKGQPTRLIRLRPQATYAIGATFTQNYIEIGLIDWAGQLKLRQTHPLSQPSPKALSEAISAFSDMAVAKLRVSKKRLCGIGLSVPGDFIEDRRIINAVYFPNLAGVDLTLAMSEALNRPVCIENDSTSAAWGETLLGAGKTLKSFLFLHIGHGIGGGLVINGRLFRGHHGNAGAFGAPYPDLNAPRPSGADLLRTLQAQGYPVEDFEDLKALDPTSDAALIKWLDRASAQLTPMLSVLARAFDPEAIIIGGRLPLPLVHGLISRIENGGFCAHDNGVLPLPRLIASELGDAGGVIGAGALTFEPRFYTPAP
ncbi:ROK family transcriptional regulator [Woodsholea maritima]|uniref:ROK family transcriptional regulator n=1 Tax=Woodsholea maritima TaxID=240237 RepID=UPI00146165D1|nr:ROK family transcriptional regulator [Woodsholea maritima]